MLLHLNFLVCEAGNNCSVRAVARTQHVHKTFSTVSGTQGLLSGYGCHASSQTLHLIPRGCSPEGDASQPQVPQKHVSIGRLGNMQTPGFPFISTLLNSPLPCSKPSLLASLFIPKESLIHILYLYLKLIKNRASMVAKDKIHHSIDILKGCIQFSIMSLK